MDFPSNSRTPPPVEEKKVEKVVVGEVTRRKQPLGKRLLQTFVAGDVKNVFGYILFEVLIPAARDTAADAVSQGIEKILFGEARSTSRRTGSSPGRSGSYVSYNRFSSGQNSPISRRDEDRGISRAARSAHNFDEIVLATRGEAETVIDRLFELLSKYEQATVADLYELVGIEATHVDNKWGWTDLRGSGATRVSNGYLLDLPRPEALK
jgi:hypothetical protein